jgi:hypothetical protein
MGATQTFQAVHTRLVALSVTDGLLRALRVAGALPPPLGDVECRIVEQTAPVARAFEPPLVLTSFRNPSGFLLIDGSYARDSDPERRFPLGDGTYSIEVRGEYYQPETFPLTWPPPGGRSRVAIANAVGYTGTVDLLPGPAYPMPDVTTARLQLGPTILRGSLFTSAGEPIRDVAVEVVGLAFLQPAELPPLGDWSRFLKVKTNENGDWAIVLPGRRYIDALPEVPAPGQLPIDRQVTVRIHYPAGAVDVPTTVRLGTEHSVRNTALRGQVVGSGGRPIAGAQVTTSVGPGASASRADGVWFLYFDILQPDVANATVTVATPEGATASDPNVQVRRGATVVVPTFRFP